MRVAVLFILLVPSACASSGKTRERAILENDGAWVRSFPADRDRAFHAALAALQDEGYAIETANPMAGWFTATSEVKRVFSRLSYRRARVMIEGAPTGGVRVRIQVLSTHQGKGEGREPNNDRPVSDRALYDRLFDRIEHVLGAA